MFFGDLVFFNFFNSYFTHLNGSYFLSLFSFLVIKIFNFFYLLNFFYSYVFFFFFNLEQIFYINFFFDILKVNISILRFDFSSSSINTISYFKNRNFHEIYFSKNFQYGENRKNSFLEKSSSQRFSRYYTTTPSYDYKTGHYLGLWEQLYPQLVLSFIEVARGLKKPN
jgi:hypothetical protein